MRHFKCSTVKFLTVILSCIMTLLFMSCEIPGVTIPDTGPVTPPPDKPVLAPGEHNVDFDYENRDRNYIIYVPRGYTGTQPVPLVLNIHPLGGTAQMQIRLSGMNALADQHGFIVVYPNSDDNSWDAGWCCAFGDPRDDVTYMLRVVEAVRNAAYIDENRIYATGFSNGGFMSHLLGCEAADIFAAIAPVAGHIGLQPKSQCAPSEPVAVYQINGTADTLVNYQGSQQTNEVWRDKLGCSDRPQQTDSFGRVSCQTASDCDGGVDVTLCTEQGGGHTWPQGASEKIWAFLSKHSK